MESTSLPQLSAELLDKAREASSGRASVSVHGGSGQHLRQIVMALAAGHALAEHESPGEAMLHLVDGRVRFTTDEAEEIELGAGDLLSIPPRRHSVHALEDSVFMLSVGI